MSSTIADSEVTPTEPTATAAGSGVVVPVKLSVFGEFRRFKAINFANLRSTIQTIVGNESFIIKYTDADSDEITMTNESEFDVAVSLLPAGGVLRCSVSSTAKEEKKATKHVKKLQKEADKKHKKLQKRDDSSESSDSESDDSDTKSDSDASKKKNRDKKQKQEKKEKKPKNSKKTPAPGAGEDSSEESSDANINKSDEHVHALDQLRAEVARLSKLHEQLKTQKRDQKASRKVDKKAKKEKKRSAKKSKKDSSDSSSAEESSSSTSRSSEEEPVSHKKQAKQGIKQAGKQNVKAARDAVQQAKQQLDEAKKQLSRELSTFKADNKGKKNFDSRFVTHVTFPDPATVESNASILKTFKFRNIGSETWGANVKLLLVSRFDNSLSAPDFVELGREVKPDEEVDVCVPLKAPTRAGQYDAFFRLALADGRKFGQRVRSRILVATPAAAPAPAAAPEPTPVPTTPSLTPADADTILVADSSEATPEPAETVLA